MGDRANMRFVSRLASMRTGHAFELTFLRLSIWWCQDCGTYMKVRRGGSAEDGVRVYSPDGINWDEHEPPCCVGAHVSGAGGVS